ncbi:unnamed protein product [Nippostrongylus brasiliensis]|uniref:SEA domain-containing protein n=1 Tax=Nippostrongylus brasiliensis TaxID=27835 RepID=A0A0N4XLN2_NIPBR|nr:unnamed protein product [Nippostrongylus brasiliensis]
MEPGSIFVTPRRVVNALPPVPPPAKPTHLAIHNTKKRSSPRWRVILLSGGIAAIFLILVTIIIGLLVFGARTNSPFRRLNTEVSDKHSKYFCNKLQSLSFYPVL